MNKTFSICALTVGRSTSQSSAWHNTSGSTREKSHSLVMYVISVFMKSHCSGLTRDATWNSALCNARSVKSVLRTVHTLTLILWFTLGKNHSSVLFVVWSSGQTIIWSDTLSCTPERSRTHAVFVARPSYRKAIMYNTSLCTGKTSHLSAVSVGKVSRTSAASRCMLNCTGKNWTS